ncbi:HAD family hydrolase [Flocculibacter collagenilyticus]|uniref:HAD family hydrolase n=1 Tax=Flocculibacter collagenilyticus TaxID=2744479 RepID=UPI0018F7CC17|nr:HAD-IA family hydrolase [Flocculibacter collagenilyticus]
MKILYYLESLVEQQNPFFRAGALKNTINRQAQNLLKFGHEITVFTSKHVYEECINQGVEFSGLNIIKVDLPEILSVYRNAEHSAKINYECHDKQKLNDLASFYENKLNGFVPELIISWESPNNVIKNLFSDVPCLHMMPGFFSRVPLPELTLLDPCGFFKDSAMSIFKDDIQNYQATAKELKLVKGIRETYFEGYLSSYTPFTRQSLDPENKFRKLLLLPLQVSGYFSFDFHTAHRNQMDFLISVLAQVPDDVGVVVTQYVTRHTKDTPINSDTVAFLKSNFSNFIYEPVFDSLDGVSQYLLPLVDGVISTSSSIAFQAAFMQLPVYMYGNSHIEVVSESFQTLVDSDFVLSKRDQDHVLAFILSRLMPLTINTLYTGDWLHNFITSYCVNYSDFLATKTQSSNKIFEQLVANPIHADFDKYLVEFIEAAKPHVAIRKLVETGCENTKAIVKNKEEWFKQISNPHVKTVSFDIFDTLLVRPFAKPVDLFRYIEDEVCELTNGIVNEFTLVRVKAEQNLKKKLREYNEQALEEGINEEDLTYEITIDEIYQELANLAHLTDLSLINAIKSVEIEAEVQLLYPRPSGMELFRMAKSLGKQVIITSDMYLSHKTIERILAKNNIHGYQALFVSSEIGLKKHEGHLYTYLMDKLGISNPKTILHIGDNVHGDIKAARDKEIRALHTPRTLDLFYKNKPANNLFFKNRNKASLSESITVGMCANRIYDDPKFPYWGDTFYHGSVFNLGYLGLGCMFFSYTKWIIEQAIEDGITDLYFLARDGEIIKKVYDELSPYYENAPKSHYLLASRRSARVASIRNQQDLSVVARSAFYSGTLLSFFENKLGYNPELIPEELLELHGFKELGLNTIINTNELKDNLYNLTMALSAQIVDSAMSEGELLLQYFEDKGLNDLNKNVAVVDIGYAGTMQDAMIKLLNRDIGGYYLMTFESALKLKKKGQIIKAFAGDFVNPAHSLHPICRLGLAFEVVFSNIDGSFIKMVKSGQSYMPVFESTEGEDVKREFIPKMQSGIVAFAKDVMDKFGSSIEGVYFDNSSCFSVWSNTLTKPSGRDTELFEGVTFDDNFAGAGWRYMIPPRQNGPLSDKLLKQTVWRAGTEVFFRIPYVKNHKNKPINNPLVKENKVTLVKEPNKLPGKTMSLVMRAVLRNENKLRKFNRDPDAFFSDSKNKTFRKLGKFYIKQFN